MTWEELKQSLMSTVKLLRKRKPLAIKVVAGTQQFWVKDPKKIDEWIKYAENSARGLSKDKEYAAVRIKKVIYDGQRQVKQRPLKQGDG